jgi:hypothetical protein
VHEWGGILLRHRSLDHTRTRNCLPPTQLTKYFGLPFPFNILLMPLRVVEYALAWMVYSTK